MVKKDTPAVQDYIRTMPEYEEGKSDCLFVGRNMLQERARGDGCPYEGGDRRTAWWCGFLDKRTNVRLGHIFKKHGMTFP